MKATIENKCPYADERSRNTYCKHKRCYCNGNGEISTDDNDEIEFISKSEMCAKCSLFGGSFITLNDEMIERLKNGEVIKLINEYSVMIKWEKQNE